MLAPTSSFRVMEVIYGTSLSVLEATLEVIPRTTLNAYDEASCRQGIWYDSFRNQR